MIPEQHQPLCYSGTFLFSQSSTFISVPSFKEYTRRSSPMTVTLSTTACQSFSSSLTGGAGVSVSRESITPIATNSASLFLRSAVSCLCFSSSARKRSVRSPKQRRYNIKSAPIEQTLISIGVYFYWICVHSFFY